MEFNSIVFPRPFFSSNIISNYEEELLFIPKSNSEDKSSIQNSHIPCLFIKDHNSHSKNIIIMFHGNAEDIFGARCMGDTLVQKLRMNVLIVEYPSYSIYFSEPSADEVLNNTIIIYDFVKNKFNVEDKNIHIFGRSIGTSPAIYLASKRKPNALITISAFTSIKAVAHNLVGFLKILVKERLTSIDYIKNVTCPIIFIHGQKDPLIPFKETILLKDNCDCPFEVVLPINMTHNDFDIDEDIIEPIANFLGKNCSIDKGKNNFEENEEIKNYFKIPEYIKNTIDKNKNNHNYVNTYKNEFKTNTNES
jgi:esterase/lipase